MLRLAVPLDYTNEDSESLTLNLFRVNATQQPALGNLIFNFGGPGGAGADNLPSWASQVAYIVGPRWNIISWNPRGTGYTIPFNCTGATGLAPTSNKKRELGNLLSVNTTESFLEYGWELAGQTAEACAAQNNGTGTLLGTAFVARDVMQMADALSDDGLLNYYGWSYGTALGSYIAAMFPDRIGRMVLDGNVNPHDYQSGTYADLAEDTDAAFDGFLNTCFEAKNDCSLYTLIQPNRTEDLLATINAALGVIKPLALSNSTTWLTWVGLKSQVYSPLYFPNQWPQLADLLTQALKGKTPTPAPENDAYGAAVNAVFGIRASDATFHANSSSEYLSIVRQTAKVSKSFSDQAYVPLWVSARWLMPAKERYWGDFQADTKTPILYVNGECIIRKTSCLAERVTDNTSCRRVRPHHAYRRRI
jgi:pimeloyl-ACP methyl ester carboxylesterase